MIQVKIVAILLGTSALCVAGCNMKLEALLGERPASREIPLADSFENPSTCPLLPLEMRFRALADGDPGCGSTKDTVVDLSSEPGGILNVELRTTADGAVPQVQFGVSTIPHSGRDRGFMNFDCRPVSSDGLSVRCQAPGPIEEAVLTVGPEYWYIAAALTLSRPDCGLIGQYTTGPAELACRRNAFQLASPDPAGNEISFGF